MVRSFYSWIPLVIVGAIVILSLPWLGLIALMVVAVAAVPTLLLAVALVPYMIVRVIGRGWQRHSAAKPIATTVVSPVQHQHATLRKEYAS